MSRSSFQLPKDSYEALRGLDHYVRSTGLDASLVALVKLRASQLNGCSYCVDIHVREAEQAGVEVRKLHAVCVWRQTPFFDARERAALDVAETVTHLDHEASARSLDAARTVLDDTALAGVLMTAISINAWNRVGVPLAMQPSRPSAS